jgi:hypothetical protein
MLSSCMVIAVGGHFPGGDHFAVVIYFAVVLYFH